MPVMSCQSATRAREPAPNVKMTSFGIQPPAPKIALGLISTGDDVKIAFEWNTGAAEAK